MDFVSEVLLVVFLLASLFVIFFALIVITQKRMELSRAKNFAKLSNEIPQVVDELDQCMNQAFAMALRVREHDEQLRVLEREYGELFGYRSSDPKLEEIAVQHFVLHDSRHKLSKLAGTLTARARAALSSLQSMAVKLEQSASLPAAGIIQMQAQRLREGLWECDSALRKIEFVVQGLSAEQVTGQTASRLFAGTAGLVQHSRSAAFLAAAQRNIELRLVMQSVRNILRKKDDGAPGF